MDFNTLLHNSFATYLQSSAPISNSQSSANQQVQLELVKSNTKQRSAIIRRVYLPREADSALSLMSKSINTFDHMSSYSYFHHVLAEILPLDALHLRSKVLSYLIDFKPSNQRSLSDLQELIKKDHRSHRSKTWAIIDEYTESVVSVFPRQSNEAIIKIRKDFLMNYSELRYKFLWGRQNSRISVVFLVVFSLVKGGILFHYFGYYFYPVMCLAPFVPLVSKCYFFLEDSLPYIMHPIANFYCKYITRYSKWRQCQNIEPKRRRSPFRVINFREVDAAFRHQQIVDINDAFLQRNPNRMRRYSRHYFRLEPQAWNPRKLNFRELQMDYLRGVLQPNVTVSLEPQIHSHLESLKEHIDKMSSSGIDVNLKIPFLDDIMKKIIDAWNDPKLRNTLLVLAYTLFKCYLNYNIVQDETFNRYKTMLAFFCSIIGKYFMEEYIKDSYYVNLFKTLDTALDVFTTAYVVGSLNTLFSIYREEQGDFGADIDLLSPILQAIYCWLYYTAYNKEYKGDSLSGFFKECATIKKSKEGVEDLITFLGNCFSKILKFIQGQSFSSVYSNNLFPQLDEIANKLEKYMLSFKKGFSFSKTEAEEILQISTDLEKLINKIPSSKDYAEYKRRAYALQAPLWQLVNEIKRAGLFDDGARIVPVCISIVGPPGVGKTTCITQLLYELAALTMDDEQYANYKQSKDDAQYTYNPDNVYMDRYRKQYFCIVDEFGALKDSPTMPNESFLFLLRAVNCWPFPVHMADLADKGTMFDSKIIVAIGNTKKIAINSLIDPEAVTRRFDHSILMVPKPQYCKPESLKSGDLWSRRLDKETLKGFHITDYSFMDIYEWDLSQGKLVSSSLEWRELVDRIATTYLNKKSYSLDRLSKLPEISTHCDNLRAGFELRVKSRAMLLTDEENGTSSEYGSIKAVSHDQFRSEIHCQMDDYNRDSKVERDTVYLLNHMIHKMNEIWSDFRETFLDIYYDVSDKMDELSTTISRINNSIIHFIRENPMITTLITVVPIAIMMWNSFFPKIMMIEQSVFARSKGITRATVRRSPTIVSKVAPQICSANTNFSNVVDSLLKSNHYLIVTSTGQRAAFTFIAGRVGVFPNHFYSHWMELFESGEDVVLTFTRALNPGAPWKVKFSDIKFYEICKTSDLCFALIPVAHMHRDQSKFLITREEKLFQGNFHAALIRFDANGNRTNHTTEVRCMGSFKYSHYSNERSYEYNIATTKGECGEMLISSDSRSTTKFLGIHVCGDGKSVGDSVAVFYEDYLEILDHMKKEGYKHIINPPEEATVLCREGQLGLPEKFAPMTELKSLLPGTKNNTIESPLHEAWGPSNFAPTILREHNGIDPWVKAREGYNPPYELIDAGVLKLCIESYSNVCFSAARKMEEEPRTFTFEEAVAGIPGYYKGIPRGTSAGYPLAIEWMGVGKTIPFGKEGEFTFDHPEAIKIKNEVFELITTMKSGIRPKFYYMDHLKAERRKKTKVESMEVRLFNASPLHYTIICRMYFGHATQWLTDERIFNGIAVGMNPFSDDWHRLVKYLESVRECDEEPVLGIFGDYKKFDGSFPPTILRACQEFLHLFYYNANEEDRMVRDVLFEDIINSRHVHTVVKPGENFGRSVSYEWYGSVPSGNPLTVFLNSIGNNLMIRYCCLQILKQNHELFMGDRFPDMNYLEAKIRIITYGDDNGITINKDIDCITQEALTYQMSLIGMTYTSEDKTAVHLTHRPLEECSFLKCGFRFDKDLHKWVATQELSSILDMPYWTKSNGKDPLSVHKTVDILLHKLALHGRDMFEFYAPVIIEQSMKKLQHKPQYLDYKLNRDAILDMEFEF